MTGIADNINDFKQELGAVQVQLIAISKTQPVEAIQAAYDAGQRLFGENQVQEMTDKQAVLPKDIEWHLVGHLQTNKVKFVAPYVHLIHSIDSLKLLQEIDKQGLKNNRVIDCLLQIHIADEETKFGLDYDEVIELLRSEDFATITHARIVGLMGIATNTDKEKQVREEFKELAVLFKGIKEAFFKDKPEFKEVSMGMSSDYKLAIEQGSTMIRVGSAIFGHRSYPSSTEDKTTNELGA